jgi:transcriptional regulator with XRE-family HTH domain
MGPTTARHVQRMAGNVLRLARLERGWSQRRLAEVAGVAHSTVARIESGAVQPSLPTLARLLAAADLELRLRVEPYDDHDDVLDRLTQRFPDRQAQADAVRDATLAALAHRR